MVSLRVLEQERQKKERVERLVAARQQGRQLGVASARYYQDAKVLQQRAVEQDVRSALQKQAAARAAETEARLHHVDDERGSGMRAAAELVRLQGQRAVEEQQAWEAEHELERRRALLALQQHRSRHETGLVHGSGAGEAPLPLAARRAHVKAIEAQRTQKAIAGQHAAAAEQQRRARSAAKLLSGSAATSGSPRVQLHDVPTVDLGATAVDAASAHEQERREERRLELARQKEKRAEAQQRARDAAVQKRHDEMVRQQEAAKAAELQKERVLAAAKRHGRPGFAEFQEEEMRRSERLNQQAHLAFERTFLAVDGWELADLQRQGHSPAAGRGARGAKPVAQRSRQPTPPTSSTAGDADLADDSNTLFRASARDPSVMLDCVFALPTVELRNRPSARAAADRTLDATLSSNSDQQQQPEEPWEV